MPIRPAFFRVRPRVFLPALLAAAAFAGACVDTQPFGHVGAVTSSIEDGQPINTGVDPVAGMFPLSTVNLVTPVTLADGGSDYHFCTGVILTPTKILTAAHCGTGPTTAVFLYPLGNHQGAEPRSDTDGIFFASGSPEVPDGLTLSTCLDLKNSSPDSCDSSVPSPHLADLAVLPLDRAIPAPYAPVVLGPRGSYATTHPPADGGPLPDSWTVGTGHMNVLANGCVENASTGNSIREMEWVATPCLPSSDAAGLIQLSIMITGVGDSGGPMFELLPGLQKFGPLASNLMLVGLVSAGTKCTPGFANIAHIDVFTSVEYPDNYDWLVNKEGAQPAPNVATFGASR
jgi:hypothetical protein